VVKGNKTWWFILGLPLFIIFIFLAPRPIPEETVLKPRWVTSLEANDPVSLASTPINGDDKLLPFILGDRFGYVKDNGFFSINQIQNAYISISENIWTEYEAHPSSIQILNPHNELVLVINDPDGYPLFLDNRIFTIGSEQNSITAIGPAGQALWTFDFPSPITCIDAANGYILAGTLDGVIILLNSQGLPVFPPFEPHGSRLSVILGCALSRDASRLAIISGIDNQRFLLLERTGDTYRVIYHEFLDTGFRRPVHINFVNNDAKVVFEREGGLGIYAINSRSSTRVNLQGEIVSLDSSGEGRFLFVITSQGPNEKRFITIRFPGLVVNQAPFNSENVFLARRGNRLFIGGDETMASFELEKR